MPIRTTRQPAEKFSPISITNDYKTGLDLKFTMLGWGLDYKTSSFWCKIQEDLIHEDLSVLRSKMVTLKRTNEGALIEIEYTVNEETGDETVVNETEIAPATTLATDFKDGSTSEGQTIEQYAIAVIIPLFNEYRESLP